VGATTPEMIFGIVEIASKASANRWNARSETWQR
jgi:hypothetical protein